jgi:UDPglucose 6-dehydrogenase/GDP-mannose 6-dehydrogenase
MEVSIFGTGYVGLVSGVCLAEKGHSITCVDVDAGKIEMINSGEVPINEKGLNRLLRSNLGENFYATTDFAGAVRNTEISLLSVGTPLRDGALTCHK